MKNMIYYVVYFAHDDFYTATSLTEAKKISLESGFGLITKIKGDVQNPENDIEIARWVVLPTREFLKIDKFNEKQRL